jgi:hypothetical protein
MNQKPDITHNLMNLGYTPPQTNWTRPDPRGREYGTYGIRVLGNGDIVVTYYPRSSTHVEFSFYFATLDSFERWTKHTF